MQFSATHYCFKQTKQVGAMPSVWFAINSDRTPEPERGPIRKSI